MPDPILTIIDALEILVTPSPAVTAATTGPITQWSGAATTGSAYSPIQTLLGVLFGASTDLTAAGKSINTGLKDVVMVLNKLASGLASLPSADDASKALSGLQQALTLAATLAPGAAAPVITSGSALFTQLSDLLASVPSPQHAADELAALAQQLTSLQALFPAA